MRKIFIQSIFYILTILFLFPPNASGKTDLISIHLKDADLTDVINMLSQQGGFNIVMGTGVSGKVTMDLHDVTVEDALKAALRINGYRLEKSDHIMFIEPAKAGGEETLSPSLTIKSYKVNYVNAIEILPILRQNLSKYGKVNINKSNNIIIIEDLPENLKKVDKIIKTIDAKPGQVLIEAQIMEIRLNNDTQFGIDWKQVLKSGKASLTVEGKNFALPSTSGTPGLFFSAVTPHFQMFLDALREKGNLKTLATPKLVAVDNKTAQIIIGGRLGYRVTTTINQVTTESVEFLDIGTMLRITPRIGRDGNIYLTIFPKISDGVVTQGLPSETTTEVSTNVVVKDGESIFIGGLIRNRKEKVRKEVPILGDLPIVGYLFGRTTNTISRTETVIVITPHIVNVRNTAIFEKEKEKLKSVIDKKQNQ